MKPHTIPVHYDRHTTAYEEAERRAKTGLHPLACTYRVRGFSGYRHPWTETGDFSRARAVVRAISLQASRSRPYIRISGPRSGSDVPILKVWSGVEHSWNGSHDYHYLAHAGVA